MKRKTLIFCLFSFFFCSKIFSLTMPDDKYIRKTYPTLKVYYYSPDNTESAIYYSEKFVEEVNDPNDSSGKIFEFKGVKNSSINRWFGFFAYFNGKCPNKIWKIYKMIITDTGIIYVYGQYGDFRYLTVMAKYKIQGNEILEIEQPFYYIGVQQTTKCNFKILEFPSDNAKEVALIGDNTKIEVIGVRPNGKDWENENYSYKDDWVLIRSPLGLTGWVKAFPIGEFRGNCIEYFLDIFDWMEMGE